MDKTQWLEARRKCITGTDISAIVGLNRFKTAMGVWLDKVGLAPEVLENEAMRWGNLLEPVIADRYAKEQNVTLTKGEFTLVNEIFGGTPDYLSPDKLIEIKTAGIRSAHLWGESGTDQIPEEYLCQVQWYMMLTDKKIADVIVLIGGQDYRVYTVKRNDSLIEILTKSARNFWDKYVIPQERPNIDATESTTKYLDSFFPKSQGNIISATEEISIAAHKLYEIRKQLSDLEVQEKAFENVLKDAIGTNDGIQDRTFKATWKSTKDSEKIDYEKCVRDLNISAGILKQYTATKPGYRRFLFTYTGE